MLILNVNRDSTKLNEVLRYSTALLWKVGLKKVTLVVESNTTVT